MEILIEPLHKVALAVLIAGAVAPLSFAQDTSGLDLSGSAQLLVMGRDYGGELKGESASASLTLEARSQLSEALALNGQFLHVQNLQNSGKSDAGYWLSNDTASVLNELHFDWNLAGIGAVNTNLRIGRQIPAYEFFGSYKTRHKEQSFEGLALQTKAVNGVTIDLGHIERFSSWACREGGSSAVESEFIDFGERMGFGSGDNGVQFASAVFGLGESITLTAYDYYANGFYNNTGLKGVWSFLNSRSGTVLAVSAHYIQQDGESSGFMADHLARSVEMNLSYKRGGLSLDAGWTRIDDESNLEVPFRTSYLIDATLLWYTNQFESGTDSFHFKSVINRNRWTLVGMLVEANHKDDRNEREFDAVVKYAFDNSAWVAFKGGYGRRNFKDNLPEEATDLRFFLGYSF